ncbi:MAG: S8 family serine peptidase [Bacteroidia bacterium]|nr:S8 family serine peptidase [Bacteroidia bacterium]
MKKTGLLILSFVLCCGLALAQNAFPGYQDGKVWFKLKDSHPVMKTKGENPWSIPMDQLPFVAKVTKNFQITKLMKPFFALKNDGKLQRTYEIHFTDIYNAKMIVEIINALPEIEYAELVPYDKIDLTPNDPSYPSNLWHLTKINAAGAWNYFSAGSTRKVAIVDNAVQRTHTDLSANIWVNPGEIANNGVDDDGNGYIDDINGYDVADNDNNPNPPNTSFDHGTHCSGAASATTNNGTGIAAIGWSTKIVAVKATGDADSPTSVTAGYTGISYAASIGADVISLSWGGTSSSQSAQNVINAAWNAGCVIVAAAGNSGVNQNHYPAAYTNVIAVASTTSTDAKSSFSNYGAWVDVSAPGSSIYSTIPNNTYVSMSGTSMATPIVAGLLGLMKSLNPTISKTALINCLTSTCDNINAQNPSYIGMLGAGRINANNAMACISSTLSAPPVAACSASPTTACTGQTIQLTDNSTNGPTSWSWSMPGGSPSSSTVQNPTVSYASAGTYTITLTATNSYGSSTSTTTVVVSNSGLTLPFTEGFQNTTFLPTGWQPMDAGNDGLYWSRNATVGQASTASAMYDNYNLDANGTRDEMRTPKLNLTTLSACTLTFWVAYARYGLYQSVMYSDTLEVKVSTNCGQTWTQVYLKGGNTLSTNGQVDVQNAIFVPTSNQWRQETVILTPYVGNNVMVSFINRGRYGQAIYVDNINITGTLVGLDEYHFGDFNLYPNPNNGEFDVMFETGNTDDYTVEILNSIGQVIASEQLTSFSGQYNRHFNISEYGKGVYLLAIRNKENKMVKRLIVF